MSYIIPSSDLFNSKAFENDCRSYRACRAVQEEAKQKADTVKARILAAVEQHGYVPTNAEKSRRLECPEFIATATGGDGIEINDDKVNELELLMSEARVPKLFPQLFKRRVEYSLARTADEVMQATTFPKRFSDRIRSLYGLCFRPKPRTPSLDVETRASVLEREQKAAAKAAKKKGGK